MLRRNFLGLGLSAIAVSVLNANILKDGAKAFSSNDVDGVLNGLYGKTDVIADDKAQLKVPDIAENGGAVPVTVSTSIENAKTLTLLIEKNPKPLAAVWEVGEGAIVKYSTRIKMKETGNVTLIVEDKDGKLHKTTKQVKVTVGGCGG